MTRKVRERNGTAPQAPCIKAFSERLQSLESGPIDNMSAEITSLLATAWDSFAGNNETKMAARKIHRAEKLCWYPSILSFEIERHGGTVMGSTRAEIQRWEVNLKTLEISCETVSHRQIEPMDRRLDTKRLAAEVAALIVSNSEHVLLKWLGTDKVRVNISEVIPQTYVRTTTSRRKRFRKQLTAELEKQGWEPVLGTAPNTYQKHRSGNA